MDVDVSKAAVDARVAKRDRPLSAESRVVGIGLLTGAATLVGIRLWSGEWLPILLAFIVFGLAFAVGQKVAKVALKQPAS
jgi:uncharacterized membrane protein YccC